MKQSLLMLQHRFLRLAQRDQIALVVLGLAVVLYLLVVQLLLPLQATVALNQARVATARANSAQVKQLANTLEQYRNGEQQARQPVSLAALVDSSSAAVGLQIANMEPAADGNSVGLQLETTSVEPLLQWLQQLQEKGITVDTLTILPAPGNSEPNGVTASLRLSALR